MDIGIRTESVICNKCIHINGSKRWAENTSGGIIYKLQPGTTVQKKKLHFKVKTKCQIDIQLHESKYSDANSCSFNIWSY